MEVAPTLLGGRGTPGEKSRAIMDRIINSQLGGRPHSGQTLATSQQVQNTQGPRGRGVRDSRGGRGSGDRGGRGRVETGKRSRRPPPTGKLMDEERAMRPERAERRRGRRKMRKEKSRGKGVERPHCVPWSRSLTWGGTPPPPEENIYFPVFAPEGAHLLLQGFYRDFPHHNDVSHLYGVIADDAAWQHSWRLLAAQSASWYATPSDAVGR